MHFKYAPENYPKNPVFTANTDKVGRRYFTCYSNTQGFCCVSVGPDGGENHIFDGNPKITYRKGDSKFGPEIIFELLVKRKKEVTPKRTQYESIEIYMPFDKGIKFLKDAVRHFEAQNAN